MNQSSDDFYARLGVAPGCSEADIRAAYRKRAKQLHPDTNADPGAAQEFSKLHEAYSTLGNSTMRARYDEARAEAANGDNPNLEPLFCHKCKKVTVQPRYIVFRYVISVIFRTVTTPVQGIFCARCARKAGLRATAISAVLGWWGFPWGLLRTPAEIIRNSLGGFKPPGSEQRLLWYNALAFLQRGNLDVAYGLARRVRSMSEDKIAHDASELAAMLVGRGFKPDAPPLKNPWSAERNPAPHFVMLLIVPAIVVGLIVAGAGSSPSPLTVTSGGSITPTTVNAGTAPVAVPVASPSKIASPAPAPTPVCASLPAAGEILSGTPPSSDPGHVLKISNGSEGPVIVKARNYASGNLAFSFYVPASGAAEVTGIPDGTYKFQYAIGTAMGADCHSLTGVKSVSAFPDPETLSITYEDNRVGTRVLSYTLYGVPAGNVVPSATTAEEFDAP